MTQATDMHLHRPRRRASAVALVLTVGALVGWGDLPAQAAANAYAPSIGTVTGTVATGSTGAAPTVVTTGACPAGTSAIQAFLDGGSLAQGVAIAADPVNVGNINTTGIPFSFSPLDVALNVGKVLVNGTYDVSLVCDPGFGGAFTAQFDGQFTVSGAATPTTAGTTLTWKSNGPAATTTMIAAGPAGTAVQGATVTLTATVSPSSAAGTVQFVDLASGSAVNVGSPATVSGGTASITTSSLAVGSYTLQARFTPADTNAFAASTSSTLAYTITAPQAQPPTATTTTIAANPPATATVGTDVTFTAGLAPSTAAGTVQFSDTVGGSTTPIGQPITVSAGQASMTVSSLIVGTHQITADFTPADAAAYSASSSGPLGYTITAVANPKAMKTVTRLLTIGLPWRSHGDWSHREWEGGGDKRSGPGVKLVARINPKAAGTVQFLDTVNGVPVPLGGPVPVDHGRADLVIRPLAIGSHMFTAVFTPADPAGYQGSTSQPAAFEVKAPQHHHDRDDAE